jgi:hypothetical protein
VAAVVGHPLFAGTAGTFCEMEPVTCHKLIKNLPVPS